MLSFQTGLSGLRASQVGLEVAANNISNADNPDYHRQDVTLQSRTTPTANGLQVGTGVEVDRIRRVYNSLVEGALTQNVNQQSGVDQELDIQKQIESILSPGSGSLQTQIQSLFNELTQLTSDPADPVRRTSVLQRAEALTQELGAIAKGLIGLKNSVDHRIRGEVETVNQKFDQLAKLNKQLKIETAIGNDAHQLKDVRARTLKDLSGSVDVAEFKQIDSPFGVLVANSNLLIAERAPELTAEYDAAGNLKVFVSSAEEPLTFGGGRLQALSFLSSEEIPRVQEQINELARQISFVFDKVQSTGVPGNGPHTQLASTRGVTDTAGPLNLANPQFPIGNGELFFSVTDLATGKHSLQSISVDGDVDSLADIAASISGLDHLQAVIGVEGGVSIVAEAGFAFDFAGRTETQPDTSGLSGTATIELSGIHTGETNNEFNYTIVGDGTVGVTEGLRVQVTNQAGEPIADLNIGSGYVPGSKIEVGDGIEISFASGTVVDGESVSSGVIADADESNLLVALGLGTFFTGNTAADLKVNDELLANTDLLATSRSGDAADSGNVLRMLAQRNTSIGSLGGATLEEGLGNLVRETATDVQRLEVASSDLGVLRARLEAEQAATIGVDPNEEFVRMLQFQKAFEASARIISVADENMQTLIGLVR